MFMFYMALLYVESRPEKSFTRNVYKNVNIFSFFTKVIIYLFKTLKILHLNVN